MGLSPIGRASFPGRTISPDAYEEKSRVVDLTKGESFAFLGFDFRWVRSLLLEGIDLTSVRKSKPQNECGADAGTEDAAGTAAHEQTAERS